jgi:hypothetical protein
VRTRERDHEKDVDDEVEVERRDLLAHVEAAVARWAPLGGVTGEGDGVCHGVDAAVAPWEHVSMLPSHHGLRSCDRRYTAPAHGRMGACALSAWMHVQRVSVSVYIIFSENHSYLALRPAFALSVLIHNHSSPPPPPPTPPFPCPTSLSLLFSLYYNCTLGPALPCTSPLCRSVCLRLSLTSSKDIACTRLASEGGRVACAGAKRHCSTFPTFPHF